MRYINDVFTAAVGEVWDNQRLLSEFETHLASLPVEAAEQEKLRDFVRVQLIGERSRRTVVPEWTRCRTFADRAAGFEHGAGLLLDALIPRIEAAVSEADVTFDAVLATTATGNLMPGLSYRVAQRLPGCVRPDSLLIDLGNVGCTGSLKALNLAQSLQPEVRNILLVAVEVPSTLADTSSTRFDIWQGNCTFGDGAAALWISDDPEQGSQALALECLRYTQRADAGIDLIRWGYRDYYTFELADYKTFDRDVREYVTGALTEVEAGWKEEPRWAIHPAGILLLMKISRKLGIPGEAIQPSAAHYREYSNMSSASILHVLQSVAGDTPVEGAVNLLTMGAGFNVIYGRVRRVR